jgi:protein-disulfide isomerase
MMTKVKQAAVAALVAVVFGLGMAPAAQAAEMTQEQIQQMLDELKGIRGALEKLNLNAGGGGAGAPQQPVSDKVTMDMPQTPHQIGSKDAQLVVLEYTDLQCPFCQQFHNTVFDQLKRNYVDTGKVLFVSRDFPLDFHPWARPAAIAARCAGEQGKYWDMRNTLQSNADKLSREYISQIARGLNLDMGKYDVCTNSDSYSAEINKEIAEGSAAGVNGTPSFVIGRVTNGKLEGVRLVGAMPYAQFETALKDALAK